MKKIFAKDAINTLIITNPKKIMMLSLSELSEELAYSEAAIVKALKALGYNGLKDLKKKLYINKDSSAKEEEDNLLIESIIATDRAFIDDESSKKFWNIVDNSKVTVVQAFGSLSKYSSSFSREIRKRGVHSQHAEFKEDFKYLNADVLVMLSTRGSSELNEEMIKYARNIGLKVVLISDKDHRLEETVDLLITFIHFQDKKVSARLEKMTLISYVLSKLVR